MGRGGKPPACTEGAAGTAADLTSAEHSTTPCGATARSVLQKPQHRDAYQPRIVSGENIGQTFQLVHSGNADLGFVALAQVRTLSIPQDQYWEIPVDLYTPLEQQAVLLQRSQVQDAARGFLEYLQSESAREFIVRDGYGAP